jgi:hypothetical protein
MVAGMRVLSLFQARMPKAGLSRQVRSANLLSLASGPAPGPLSSLTRPLQRATASGPIPARAAANCQNAPEAA